MSGATIVAEAFGEGACLYTEVLGLPSSGADVTAAQLRKAYYKRALIYHPDKQNGKTDDEVRIAKGRFQAVSVAYSVLSNPETRAEYDETGELVDDEESADQSGTASWYDYFSEIFGKVTTDDIDKFEAKYKCSEEEEADVLKYYKSFKGNLDKMLECVMLSKEIDKKRWVEDYIEPAINRGDVERYEETLKRTMGSNDSEDEEMDDDETESEETETEDDSEEEKKASPKIKKSKSSKKNPPPKKKKEQTKHKKNTSKASGRKKEACGGPDADLIAAIRGNAMARSGRSFDAMMAGLEERYSGGGRGKTKPKKGKGRGKGGDSPPDDIPDDEFASIQARLDAKRKSK